MNSFNYQTNGFEIYDDNDKIFIAYQAIVRIDDVDVNISYNNYDVMTRRYVDDFVKKYSSYDIHLNNGKIIEVVGESKQFRRMSNDIVGWKYLKMFFTGKLSEGIDDKAREWLKNKELDMFDSVLKLREHRKELIEHFNNWRSNQIGNDDNRRILI